MASIGGFTDFRFPKFSLAFIKVPIIDWIKVYTKDEFVSDLVAGLTVFVLLIPQGMAYSVLAGMPPVYGLYTATIPLFIYAILGTSRELSLGPMAITSLLLGSSAQSLGYNSADTDTYIPVILNMSMLCGITLFVLGTFRLGILANFLSHSVLTGFVTASALLIALSQIKYILGIKVPRFDYTHQTIFYIFSHLKECNPYSMLIGISAWIGLYYVKIWKKKNKSTPKKMESMRFRITIILINLSSLLAIIFGAMIAYIVISKGKNLQVVGYVPPGFKVPSFSFINFSSAVSLIPSSIIIALVSFSGNWAVAKRYSLLNMYEVDATQELIAQGLSNIIGVLFNSFVVSGGLARTAVNAESGAKTQISGCIAAVCILISLQLFTSIFYYIPLTILGAIIEVSVASMVDFDEMIKAYHIDRKDFAVMVTTALCTFFVGISEGILMGVVLSVIFVMNATAFPYIAHLGKLPESEGGYYKDVTRFPSAVQIPSVAIVRMDASLYFANTSYFREVIRNAAQGKYHTSTEKIHLVVLDVSAWIDIDLSGINTLVELHSELLGHQVQLAFANAKGYLRDRLKSAEFVQKLGDQFLQNSVEDAVRVLPQRRMSYIQELKAVESEYKSIPSVFTPRSASLNGDYGSFDGLDIDELNSDVNAKYTAVHHPFSSISMTSTYSTLPQRADLETDITINPMLASK